MNHSTKDLTPSASFDGATVTFVIGGIVCKEVNNLDYDDLIRTGHFDYALSNRNVESMIYESLSSEEIDVYFDNGTSRFKLEIDGVEYEGTTMNINTATSVLQRRIHFSFGTTTFSTYNQEDTPWYKEQHELVEV